MGDCILCNWVKKFEKFPGFICLKKHDNVFLCVIKIDGHRRRIGSYNIEELYDTVKDAVESLHSRDGSTSNVS